MQDNPSFERRIKGAVRTAAFLVAAFSVLIPIVLGRYVPGADPYWVPLRAYRILLGIMGFRVRVWGEIEAAPGTLYVANHTSYLDIPVLGSVIPALFVAKSEVAGWPMFGFMAQLYGTLFIERRAARAAKQKSVMREKMEQGWRLILFPEGTSTDGLRTLKFKSSLFSIAEDPLPDGHAVRVQPVSVIFRELAGVPAGRALRPYYSWYGDMTLVKHLWNVFCLGHFTVDVILHPSRSLAEAGNRKALAEACHADVAAGVCAGLSGAIHKTGAKITTVRPALPRGTKRSRAKD